MHEELTDLYNQRKREIKKRLREFQNVPPDEYFYEMVYCLLTPQTSALNAAQAVHALQSQNYYDRNIDPLPFLRTKEYYIRFHHTKAKRLDALKDIFEHVKVVITDRRKNAFEKRAYLVSAVNGYGLKEATHFLRNIGMNEGLAILDRHILRNLHKFGGIAEIPNNLTEKHYYRIEEAFKDFATEIGIPPDELDLLFWSMETGMILK